MAMQLKKMILYLLPLLCLPLAAIALGSTGQPVPPFRPGKDYALFFAVEQYREMVHSTTPSTTRRRLPETFGNFMGSKFTNTEVVRNPTRNEIYDKLDAYQRKAYAEDAQLLIFFSGHGDFIETKGEGSLFPKTASSTTAIRILTSLMRAFSASSTISPALISCWYRRLLQRHLRRAGGGAV
ncbi:MAG: caspase family protein [Lewinellaceae bacterium]|nr:caspase family protein [Lewinellaceae bacterium]